jgi:hypothetical protein
MAQAQEQQVFSNTVQSGHLTPKIHPDNHMAWSAGHMNMLPLHRQYHSDVQAALSTSYELGSTLAPPHYDGTTTATIC